ncbi:50S ribosome-binding GTPase [Candidatus Woesearchaeota archaeon]|nr:50S ribosome-binding GTPase [Candidatus Woesearchaeota archaeon]
MNFQTLITIASYQTYLDVAFRDGREAATRERARTRHLQKSRKYKEIGSLAIKLIKEKKRETARLKAMHKTLRSQLGAILRAYPSIDNLPPFYHELVKITLNYTQLKKSLANIQWVIAKLDELAKYYLDVMKNARNKERVERYQRAFYGRVSSLLQQIDASLQCLETARKTMRKFPTLKTEKYTVTLCGFPNVGKTTILTLLTKADPDIQSYPFTTKSLNIGYRNINNHSVQVIDTPGALDRPFTIMNAIEKQAVLALTYATHDALFVIDPTETCGYALEKQLSLYTNFRAQFSHLNFLLVVNKSDLITPQLTHQLQQDLPKDVHVLSMSGKTGEGIPAIIAYLTERVNDFHQTNVTNV